MSTLVQSGSTWEDPVYVLKELNWVLILNWLLELELFLAFKLRTYVKVNCLK